MMQTPARRRYAVFPADGALPVCEVCYPRLRAQMGRYADVNTMEAFRGQRYCPSVSNGDCYERGAWSPALLAPPDSLPVRADGALRNDGAVGIKDADRDFFEQEHVSCEHPPVPAPFGHPDEAQRATGIDVRSRSASVLRAELDTSHGGGLARHLDGESVPPPDRGTGDWRRTAPGQSHECDASEHRRWYRRAISWHPPSSGLTRPRARLPHVGFPLRRCSALH